MTFICKIPKSQITITNIATIKENSYKIHKYIHY